MYTVSHSRKPERKVLLTTCSTVMYANSGIAANTLLRSLAGAGFPLFANQMYSYLGVDWATSLLAFICVAMIPVPVLFFIYGKKIRQLSKFSPS